MPTCRSLVSVAASASVLVALAACSTGSGGDADDRVVPVAGTVDLSGSEVEVVLPSGQLTITVTEPRDVVPAADADDRSEHEAPEGQAYVGLGWAQSGVAPAFGPILHGSVPRPASVVVRAGGETVDVLEIDTQEGSGGGAWVLVPEGLSGAVAEITYDGLTQTVDLADATLDAGGAAGLYDIQLLPTACSDAGESGPVLTYSIDCTTSAATATPYVAGRGWAPEGSTWLVLDLTVQPSTFRGTAGGHYDVDRQTGEVGTAEVLSGEELPSAGYAVTLAVTGTIGEPTELAISRSYTLTRSGAGSGPATTTASYDARIHVTALTRKED